MHGLSKMMRAPRLHHPCQTRALRWRRQL